MEKIPTANELFEQYHGFEADSSSRDIISLMVEFTKLHVEAALKEASEKAIITAHIPTKDDDRVYQEISKVSILNSYSLDNIK